MCRLNCDPLLTTRGQICHLSLSNLKKENATVDDKLCFDPSLGPVVGIRPCHHKSADPYDREHHFFPPCGT